MSWTQFDYENPPPYGVYWMVISFLSEGGQNYDVELVDYSWNPDVDEGDRFNHYFDIIEIDDSSLHPEQEKLVLLYQPVQREPLPIGITKDD